LIELLRSLHRRAADRLRPAPARIAVAVLAVLAVGSLAWPAFRVAQSLSSQRAGILAALGRCSAAERDTSATQLLSSGTVSANGRLYGGARVVANPVDLFEDDGTMSDAVKQEFAWALVVDQVPDWMPAFLARSPGAVASLAVGAAAVLALVAWLGLALAVVEVGVPVAGAAALAWWAGWPRGGQWILSAAASMLLLGFMWRGAAAALRLRGGALAVGSNTVTEGVRTLAAVGLALPVALVLPMLALSRGPEDALFQAIPGFLDWGHTAVFACASVFVLFFGCMTSATEVRDRQVWSVVSKPVSAGSWMLGKWAGTLALGAVVVAGGTVLLGVGTAYLASQRPLDERDGRDVADAVLVARSGTLPQYEQLPPDRLAEIVEQVIEGDAVLKADIANGTVDGASQRRAIAAARQKEFIEQQRRVGPGDSREFTFRGLGAAVAAGMPMSLRFRMHGAGDDEHQRFTTLFQWTSGSAPGVWEPRTWTPGDAYSMRIDPASVDPDGTLRLRIWNLRYEEGGKEPVPNSITLFLQPNSLEVMVTESTFLGNLVRAALVDLAKLAFLAALATVAGALLSFPIAVLLAFGVFSMASLAPFLATALDNWAVDPKAGPVGVTLQAVVFGIGTAVEWTLGAFAAQSPSDALAQGRAIAPGSLLRSVGGIGLGWTLAIVAFGWVALRRKEMAVYSGQS
jgi:hypothetical protein